MMPRKTTHLGIAAGSIASVMVSTALVFFAGCGGGTKSPTVAPPTGSVDVTIEGLPVGTNGDVTLEGVDGFVQRITASGLVAGIPEGNCTITAHPVESDSGDTLVVANPVRVLPVVENSTSTVILTYESTSQPVGAITIYHGPLVFQGAQRTDTFVPREDYGQPPTTESAVDTYSLPYPAGYVLDGCEIVGTDVTTAGVTINTSISGPFGSGSAQGSIVAASKNSVTITANASGSASGSSAYVGNGATTGSLNLGYPGPNRLYDACIAIENPAGTPFDLVFTWSYSGNVVNTENAYWHQRFVYQIDPTVCVSNPDPTELYWGRDFTGPAADSGTSTIRLSGTRHVVAFGMWAEASGGWTMDFLGRGGNGTASCAGTVTIEIVR